MKVLLTDADYQMLHSLSESTGRLEGDLIHEALSLLKARVDLENRRALLQSARGMWRDRDDLPSLAELRREMDRESATPSE